MARTPTPAAAQSTDKHDQALDETRELAIAAESADLQTHHLWLHCVEQTRRAQTRLAREFAEDMLDAGRRLAASRGPTEWFSTQADCVRKCLAHGVQAHTDALAAWSDLHAALAKDLQANARTLPWMWVSEPRAARPR